MIIACPACSTRYAVPDNAIGVEGRTVRCAKCKHSWYQDGSSPEDLAAPAPQPRPAPAPDPQPPVAAPAPSPQPTPEPRAAPPPPAPEP
ncbi:MJ0042-type zinc finger domain-containing protein, partial [Novosphingobium sp. BW1]|uniref:MJ0042-type zinc finger domain-containing protein n=1 Tax=Novosphingobium sp. BW1 TaxID=2592621 RepID=UPI001F0727A8